MIDIVHDIAESYRKLLDASSYPGSAHSLKKFIKNNTLETPFYETTLLFVYMLLDSEVTFCVVGDNTETATNYIAKLTYAKSTSVEEADFIFILSDAKDKDRINAIELSKIGTLVDPHRSATIISEVSSVSKGKKYTASGPGIKKEKEIQLDYADGWAEARGKKNREFPLGVEMYFVDKECEILALPRTTILKSEED